MLTEPPTKKAKRQRKLIPAAEVTLSALRNGERLMVTHPDPMKASLKASYSLLPSGRGVSEAAHYAIRHLLEPENDGLLPEASQTFTLKEGP